MAKITAYAKIKFVEKVLDWCIKHYGKSKYFKTYPILIISYRKTTSYHGEFNIDEDGFETEIQLIMYINNLHTISQLVQTVIHEYQHYLQHQTWLSRYYDKTHYEDNQYEKKAEKEAKSIYRKCMKQLNLKYTKKRW